MFMKYVINPIGFIIYVSIYCSVYPLKWVGPILKGLGKMTVMSLKGLWRGFVFSIPFIIKWSWWCFVMYLWFVCAFIVMLFAMSGSGASLPKTPSTPRQTRSTATPRAQMYRYETFYKGKHHGYIDAPNDADAKLKIDCWLSCTNYRQEQFTFTRLRAL